MLDFMVIPEKIAALVGEKDIQKVRDIMKLSYSILTSLPNDGEVSMEGLQFIRINEKTLIMNVEILEDALDDVLEGQTLIRLPI